MCGGDASRLDDAPDGAARPHAQHEGDCPGVQRVSVGRTDAHGCRSHATACAYAATNGLAKRQDHDGRTGVIHALSDGGLRALVDAASQGLLYAFDFDGTLAPISSDRQAVTASAGTLQLLGMLAKLAPCAIVSGRALADVARRVDGYVPHLIGNHGLESPLTPRRTLMDAEETCAKWTHQLESSPNITPAGAEI